jgi:hypothetical protein
MGAVSAVGQVFKSIQEYLHHFPFIHSIMTGFSNIGQKRTKA